MMRKQKIILLLIVFTLNCSAFAKPTKVEYLIPKDFTGGVIVIYDQPDGVTPDISKDGTVTHRIPKDGFLKVNAHDEADVYNYSFYYVDDTNNRTPIEYILPKGSSLPPNTNVKTVDTVSEDEKNNRVFVMNHRTIGFMIKEKSVPLYAFSVGYPKDSRHLYISIDFRIGDIEKQLSNKRP